MKKSEIKVGQVYHNGKGLQRRVLAFPPRNPLYAQEVSFFMLNGKFANISSSSTLQSFARWAKGIVKTAPDLKGI